jgi:hypothetical protein
MNRYSLLLLILLISSYAITGCSKKKNPENIPEQLIEYAVFQQGSYWIFKNENSGELDSTFISVPPTYFPINTVDGSYIQECSIRYGGSLFGVGIVDPSEYQLIRRYSSMAYHLLYFDYTPGQVYPWNTIKVLVYDSLYVNNQLFTHVVNTQYDVVSHGYDTTWYTFYTAKNTGLIKFNIHSTSYDSTWSVIRYKIY